jgi:prepilin-type N-terminal cleavage/methylation domain-containing protein
MIDNARRRAYSLVELLVVMAIVGFLVALLIPAVQAAREAVRRTSCSNHLSQLILAIQNYEMLHGVYPAGTLDARGPIVNVPAPTSYHHSWTVQILPFIEEQNTWNAIDKTVGVYHANSAAAAASMPAFMTCPSSGQARRGPQRNISSYAGCHHHAEQPIDADNSGAFILNAFLRYDDMTDGLSQTIFIGEKLADAWDQHWLSGTRATLRNVGTAINGGGARWRPPEPGGATDAVELPFQGLADFDVSVGFDEDSLEGYLSAEDDEAASKDLADARASPWVTLTAGTPLYVGGFSSYHPSGAMFAMGDGSVRFVNNNINTATLQELAHRSDGRLSMQGF